MRGGRSSPAHPAGGGCVPARGFPKEEPCGSHSESSERFERAPGGLCPGPAAGSSRLLTAPHGPAAQGALRRVRAAFPSPLVSLPHACLHLGILRRLNAFSAAAVSALTQGSAGWGFPAILAVHIQLFYHISVSSQAADECFACSNFICFTELQCCVIAVSYFVSQSSGKDYFNSGLKSERIRMSNTHPCVPADWDLSLSFQQKHQLCVCCKASALCGVAASIPRTQTFVCRVVTRDNLGKAHPVESR